MNSFNNLVRTRCRFIILIIVIYDQFLRCSTSVSLDLSLLLDIGIILLRIILFQITTPVTCPGTREFPVLQRETETNQFNE